jgi:DNA-binding PadR family transcriptional regulator
LGRFEEPAVLVLTSLLDGPRHGYAIMKDVQEVADVRLGPGTLYATLARLEALRMVEPLPAADRRHPYRITAPGCEWLRGQLERMAVVARVGLARLQHA